ncbi:MAG: hypothetical protein K0Q79_111 [Flavipsychrobacter sp.]|jgi:hypothetical protein|nr:hypothetical protein [Flavipsychrobacter sp.]
MSRSHSFVITLSNNITEKEGIKHLIENQKGFFEVNKASKKEILSLLNLDVKYSKTFDLIYIPNLDKVKYNNTSIETHIDDIILVELKTTKKFLPNNPKGFFFGATENEFNFAKQLGDKFRFCFVSLHKDSISFSLLTLGELENIIRNKRIQFQINL